jgi:hypothetical protein
MARVPVKLVPCSVGDSEDVADCDAGESEEQRESQTSESHRCPVGHLGDIVEELLADTTLAWLIGHWTFQPLDFPTNLTIKLTVLALTAQCDLLGNDLLDKGAYWAGFDAIRLNYRQTLVRRLKIVITPGSHLSH